MIKIFEDYNKIRYAGENLPQDEEFTIESKSGEHFLFLSKIAILHLYEMGYLEEIYEDEFTFNDKDYGEIKEFLKRNNIS